MKIGAITVGQSPRVDVTADIMNIFSKGTVLIEKGGLDGLTKENIAKFAPVKDDYVLVSRLNDGSSVTFAEKHIMPRLQDAIDALEDEGVQLIMMFCTGKFPDTLTSKVPLIYPCDLLDRTVPLLTKKQSILVVTPSQLQIEQSYQKWSQIVNDVRVIAASPYENYDALVSQVESLRDIHFDLIVLDCIGYTQKMKHVFYMATGVPVVLPRTLLARVIAEITDEGKQ